MSKTFKPYITINGVIVEGQGVFNTLEEHDDKLKTTIIDTFAERLHDRCGYEEDGTQYPYLLYEPIIDEIVNDLKDNANEMDTFIKFPYPVGTILSTKIDGIWRDDKIDHYIVNENGISVVLILNHENQPQLSEAISIDTLMSKWVPVNTDINTALTDLKHALIESIDKLETYDKNHAKRG